MIFVLQSVWVGKMGSRAAKLFRKAVHHLHKALCRASYMGCNGGSCIISGIHQKTMQKLIHGHLIPGPEAADLRTGFQYENRRQKNAVYNVYAGADIVTAYGTKVYSKGDLVKENLMLVLLQDIADKIASHFYRTHYFA